MHEMKRPGARNTRPLGKNQSNTCPPSKILHSKQVSFSGQPDRGRRA